MEKWIVFQNKIVDILDCLDGGKIPYLDYAKTYARNILANIEEAEWYKIPYEEATKTQMLYVISNLDGAGNELLNLINEQCKAVGVDISDGVKEMLGEEQ